MCSSNDRIWMRQSEKTSAEVRHLFVVEDLFNLKRFLEFPLDDLKSIEIYDLFSLRSETENRNVCEPFLSIRYL